jgi:uncharacterized protein (TIGR01777 family)
VKIAIAGATGLIGTALTGHLARRGHLVTPISRAPMPGGIRWDPAHGDLPPRALEGFDAIINLTGANLGEGRWTGARKRLLVSSRTDPASLLARIAAESDPRPAVIISASAVGIYGDGGDRELDESSPAASDFLGQLALRWEAAMDPAREAGIRVVHPRMGVVLSQDGGALAKMLPFFRLGLGGPLGSGQQWMSWIALADVVGAYEFLLQQPDIAGPVNLVSPNPVRNREFAETLGRVLHRPALLPVPAFALKLLFGEMAEETVLVSQRVVAGVLKHHDFPFGFPLLAPALASG